MTQFEIYFQLGKEHILDYRTGYGYILFAIALFTVYLMRDWRKVLLLLTAFTAGHAISLALSALKITTINQQWVEFFIPVVILITAVSNIFRSSEPSDRTTYVNYGYALCFGLLQALRITHNLKGISGKDSGITSPLFAYILGLELGQLIIISIYLIISFILVDLFTVNRRDWKLVLSSAIGGMALLLLKEKMFW